MYIQKFFNNILSNENVIQNNNYSVFLCKNINDMVVSVQLNSFGTDKNLKLVKLFFLLFFVTAQRPFVKKIKFAYIKKQILKKFFFVVNLRKSRFYNLFFYFLSYYLFYFNIYYLASFKYNFNKRSFVFYLDNIHTHFKSYGKLNIKSQIKFTCISNTFAYNQFIKILNSYTVLNIKKATLCK